jgi:tRNA(adenine34) deaminase
VVRQDRDAAGIRRGQGVKADDATYLRQAIGLAEQAVAEGRRPFGSVVVAADGRVVAEASSTQGPDRDWTAHSELSALREACKRLSWEELEGATLYASGEPCPMCAGALFWCNLRRLVFGLGEAGMREMRGRHPRGAGLLMGCREVLSRSPRPIEVVGPMLEDEARRAHEAFWKDAPDAA